MMDTKPVIFDASFGDRVDNTFLHIIVGAGPAILANTPLKHIIIKKTPNNPNWSSSIFLVAAGSMFFQSTSK